MNIPPIAMLHHVSDDPAHSTLGEYCIQRKSFSRLLDYLEKHQYKTITFREIAEGISLPKKGKTIILTFDDCSRKLFDFAIPELVKHKQKACFYMPTAHLGQTNSWDVAEGRAKMELMNETDLKELHNLGMEVGSHSHHHIKLAACTTDTVKQEVWTSKQFLESILPVTLVSFSYPFASVPENYKDILLNAGFSFGLSIYQPNIDKLALRRFGYYDKDVERRLHFKLSNTYKWYRSLSDPFKKYNKN